MPVRLEMAEWFWSAWAAGGMAWLAGVVLALGRAVHGIGNLTRLGGARPPAPDRPYPTVSVVLAARNEAATLQPAITSILASDYPALELVAVDDRSTDGTGEILEALAAQDARLRVLRVRDLPRGWLGKNHALQKGAEAATGEWLLFTDADVRFSRDAVAAALALADREGLDHLTAVPALIVTGLPLRLFLSWMLLVFSLWQQPWEAPRQDRRASAGMGAFNLVRREAYWATGGHSALRLALADDVILGARLKASGCRQALALACSVRLREPPALEIQWYPSLAAAIQGFEKNAFAMFAFRPLPVAIWSLMGALLAWGPLVAAVMAPGWHKLPWAAAYLLTATTLWYAGRSTVGPVPWGSALLFPVGQTLLSWTVLRSAVVTLWQGGVNWRDTFYSLTELRAASGREPERERV